MLPLLDSSLSLTSSSGLAVMLHLTAAGELHHLLHRRRQVVVEGGREALDLRVRQVVVAGGGCGRWWQVVVVLVNFVLTKHRYEVYLSLNTNLVKASTVLIIL